MFRSLLTLSLITGSLCLANRCEANNQNPLVPAAAPTPELLGRWEDSPGLTSVELEVGQGAMFSTITAALAAAPAAGLGQVPITINIKPGIYSDTAGEIFPLVIPAHGITLEGIDLGAGEVSIQRNQNQGANAMVLFSSVGNEALPPSVLRGLKLDYRYMDATGTAASIRMQVTHSGSSQASVMPEIRDCRIGGDFSRGIEIYAMPWTIVEPVIERNEIISNDPVPYDGVVGILVDGWPFGRTERPSAEAIPLTSPYIRANRVSNYKTNVQIDGGEFYCRPRLWSNLLHDGGVNLAMEACAPNVQGNTIAFGDVAGTRWVNLPELHFTSNCVWNPASTDVAAPGSLPMSANTFVAFNCDEDGMLGAQVPSNQYLLNYGFQPALIWNFTSTPQFAGGDASTGVRIKNRDLHLTSGSPLIDMGLTDVVGLSLVPTTQTVGAGSNSRIVRTDCAYDFDFQSRLLTGSFQHQADMGADEFDAFGIVFGGVSSPISGAPAMDRIGNLRHNPAANRWETEVVVQSNGSVSGNLTLILAGTGNLQQLALPNGLVLENGSVYQHASGAALAPGLLENELGLDFFTQNCLFTVGFGTTGSPIHLALPAYNPSFAESEVQLTAATLIQPDPANINTWYWAFSNRIDLELN